ncbi:hypothetical protein MNBD_NITROSPIRAE03-292 [hydrothermal vent metagenome]|uniref:Uncharacterized protein n=1 Tax=hydrothermal vent metagenome TaxID=652676 RepID=A0A3B1DFE3_9ZZZZ
MLQLSYRNRNPLIYLNIAILRLMSIKFIKAQYDDSLTKSLSEEARYFLEPRNSKQRQYEALRAYFVENLPVKVISERFNYTPGAFHVLCHQFRNDADRGYFIQTKPGPKYGPGQTFRTGGQDN